MSQSPRQLAPRGAAAVARPCLARLPSVCLLYGQVTPVTLGEGCVLPSDRNQSQGHSGAQTIAQQRCRRSGLGSRTGGRGSRSFGAYHGRTPTHCTGTNQALDLRRTSYRKHGISRLCSETLASIASKSCDANTSKLPRKKNELVS